MKRETKHLQALLSQDKEQTEDRSCPILNIEGTVHSNTPPAEGTESIHSESPSLKSDEHSSGIWPSSATSPSTILLSQYSMLGANSLSDWQKALEVRTIKFGVYPPPLTLAGERTVTFSFTPFEIFSFVCITQSRFRRAVCMWPVWQNFHKTELGKKTRIRTLWTTTL